ncbi:LuxR C-terminal-related transcriptional regulator [Pseudomonas cichorii]|nr:LuxR C-terminal-related transcriptional regulator [Pseudomonas cichorii]
MPHTIFPQIGRVMANIGNRNFSRAFHELINTQLAVDAAHLHALPQPWQSPPSSGRAMFDDTVASRGHVLFTDSAHLYPEQESDGYCCRITVFRAPPSPCFSAAERRRLKDISPFLFSILEKHVQALQTAISRAEASKTESLEDRFHERLRETGLKLSERETQVCLGLLAGHTALEQAERLTLKVNTVGSYQRRAAVKLGISGRHSLMRWMYATPEVISMAN